MLYTIDHTRDSSNRAQPFSHNCQWFLVRSEIIVTRCNAIHRPLKPTAMLGSIGRQVTQSTPLANELLGLLQKSHRTDIDRYAINLYDCAPDCPSSLIDRPAT